MANKDKLYNKRYKTLAEHRAAVKARKLLEGGKNKGPVANADAYGSTIKKKPASKAPTSPSKASSKPSAPKPKAKPSKAASKRFYSSSSQGEIAKKQNKEKAKSNFFAGGKGGKYDKQMETKPVFNRRGRQTGTKTVEKKKETPKKKRTYNRRGRMVG